MNDILIPKSFKTMLYGSYLNRSSSSKSISTSTTLRKRSPSIQLNGPTSPRGCVPPPQSTFIDSNLDSLNSLRHLISNEDNILEYYRRWCSDMNKRIESAFSHTSAQIASFLAEQQLKMKKDIQNDFVRFLNFFKEVKNQMRSIYNTKQQLQSQKVVYLQKKFSYESNEYYANQHLEARSQYDLENEQRSNFRGHNDFYRDHQDALYDLSRKAEEQLRVGDKLEEKAEQFDFVLRKFKQTIDQSCQKMKDSCSDLLTF